MLILRQTARSVIPGATGGVQAYHAADNANLIYLATTSLYTKFLFKRGRGYFEPVINATKSGFGNGNITSMDLKTGKIRWQTPIDFPTRVSPLVTNGIVISGYYTSPGKPYTANTFGLPIESPILPSGILVALDKDNGKVLWQFNMGSSDRYRWSIDRKWHAVCAYWGIAWTDRIFGCFWFAIAKKNRII